MNSNSRDFNTISPSAKTLLLLKGLTNIPFAKEAAELISLPEKYVPDYSSKEIGFWARVVHFESRYWSIDQLLPDLPVKNILELSSGFSFRGLEAIKQSGVHYIDTDLPDLIESKKYIVAALQPDQNAQSKLEIIPLNALDEERFMEIIDRLPEGEIVIVNEGLMMYLNNEEKGKLCSIIHKVLKQRGGYWITADIYVKGTPGKFDLKFNDELERFLKDHNIEENKFDSFDTAIAFFNKAGFVVDKEAQADYSKLTSLKYLLQNATTEQLANMQKNGKIQATWRLKIAI